MNTPRNFRHTHGAFWRGFGLACLLSQWLVPFCHAAGTVVAWGANDSGQILVPPGLAGVMAVAAGESHSLALRTNGTVVAWGFNASGQTNVPPTATGVTAIGGGSAYSLALKSNGTVVVWGAIAIPPASVTNVTAIAAGWTHALALKGDGTVVAWGSQTTVPANVTNILAVAAGNGFSLALRPDGTVFAWGDNTYGQTNVPPSATNVMAIAAGGTNGLALRRDGSIVAWGANGFGQANVPPGLTAIAIGVGGLHCVAMRPDGSLAAWGDDSLTQTDINQTLPGYIGIAAGGYHSLAIKGDNFPVILVQPLSQVVSISKNVTLQVVAAGAPTLTYQWQYNGTNISGATSSLLQLTNFQSTNNVTNLVVVANSYGSIVSAPAILTPNAGPPNVTIPLQNQTVICGDSTSFQISVDGSGPFTYQWKTNGVNIPNATQSILNLVNVSTADAKLYSVFVTNVAGWTSNGATLTVTVQPPQVTSAPSAAGTQGQPFNFTITALHTPSSFSGTFLPTNLTVNPVTGLISGTPMESGTFNALIAVHNACTSYTTNLLLNIASSAPVITSSLLPPIAVQGTPYTYQVTATQSPTSFGAQNLPSGLLLAPSTGRISGTPVYPGDFFSTIFASNIWGYGSAMVHFVVTNAQITGLSIGNLAQAQTNLNPYLLEFTFTLRDSQGNGIITDPNLVSTACFEDFPDLGPLGQFYLTNNNKALVVVDTNASLTATAYPVEETGIVLSRSVSGKAVKVYLVLDFSDSVSNPYINNNGGPNPDGSSVAVSNMVAGAQYFVNQQPAATQMGVVEFHRDDVAPARVWPTNQPPPPPFTKSKSDLDAAIGGIWTNNVKGFYAGSRCWDALTNAILAFGPADSRESRYVTFISDGLDYSSTASTNDVVTLANTAAVQIYAIAFGENPDLTTLSNITAATHGRLSITQPGNPSDLFNQFTINSGDIQAQYTLRWATVRRSAVDFLPEFQLTYQGFNAGPPAWGAVMKTDINTDTNNPPTFTNTYILWTNPSLTPYDPPTWAGPVTNGVLSLILDDNVKPSGITLRAEYVPRYIRQIQFYYRPNWPCTTSLESTNDALNGWILTESPPDAAGGKLVTLTSPNPSSQATSIPFAWFGPLLTFTFKDTLANPSNAFSFITISNSIYTTNVAGGQTFSLNATTNQFFTSYPPLPHGTPIPWLMYYGFSGNFTNAELLDSDNDGMPNWKEYLANTIPTNAASVFKLNSVFRQGDGRFQINFNTTSNRTYTLQSSTNLGNWQNVQTGIVANGNVTTTITDTNWLLGNTIYYRALVY